MHIQILNHQPISGTIEERWFDAVGDCLWVRFEDDEGVAWVGVFGKVGFTQVRAAVGFNEGRSAFVIAGGQGYVVDLETRSLRYKTDYDAHVSAIAVPGRDLIITCDYTCLLPTRATRVYGLVKTSPWMESTSRPPHPTICGGTYGRGDPRTPSASASTGGIMRTLAGCQTSGSRLRWTRASKGGGANGVESGYL